MLNKLSDLELLAEISKGNELAFDEIIKRYQEKAYSLALRLTRNNEDAEEVLQDVFTTVYRKIKSFEGKSSFSSWLYRITVNTSLMKLRKKRQDRSIHMEDLQAENNNPQLLSTKEDQLVDHQVHLAQLRHLLSEAISKLPEEYREVFILRDIDGLTSIEVGKILKITIPAVKSRLHRSRLILRRRLSQIYRDSAKDVSQKKVAENI
jgi:RNA polymerase sigma-70 factor (ECF subfamily)